MGKNSEIAATEGGQVELTAREKRAAEIDRITEQYDRKEKYCRERDAAHGVSHVEDIDLVAARIHVEETVVDGLLYWDTLRTHEPKTALVMLLRAIGHSCTEISAGLGMEYWRVKALTRTMYGRSRA